MFFRKITTIVVACLTCAHGMQDEQGHKNITEDDMHQRLLANFPPQDSLSLPIETPDCVQTSIIASDNGIITFNIYLNKIRITVTLIPNCRHDVVGTIKNLHPSEFFNIIANAISADKVRCLNFELFNYHDHDKMFIKPLSAPFHIDAVYEKLQKLFSDALEEDARKPCSCAIS